MDFLQFIPSKDVVDYIRQTGYKPTSDVAASIVNHSNRTLKEKHEAYREIIATMPDVKLECAGENSLHNILKQLIEVENKTLDFVCKAKDVIVDMSSAVKYEVCVESEHDKETERDIEYANSLTEVNYKDLESCLSIIDKLPKSVSYSYFDITVKFPYAKEKYNAIYLTVNSDKEVCQISSSDIDGLEDSCDISYKLYDCDKKRRFPSPFKDGDVVVVKLPTQQWQFGVYSEYNHYRGLYISSYSYKDVGFLDLSTREIIYAEKTFFSDIVYLAQQFSNGERVMDKAVSALLKHKISLADFIRINDYYRASQGGELCSEKNLKKYFNIDLDKLIKF